jgi:hypothetical protein
MFTLQQPCTHWLYEWCVAFLMLITLAYCLTGVDAIVRVLLCYVVWMVMERKYHRPAPGGIPVRVCEALEWS